MPKVTATYCDQVIAQSEDCVELEGNYYFPKKDIKFEFLTPTETTTHCPWKGHAHYLTVQVGENVAKDGCWTYPEPTEEARRLTGYYAFWGDIKVKKEEGTALIDGVCQNVANLLRGIRENTQGVEKKCPNVMDEVQKFQGSLGKEGLTYTLPASYINEVSFFNFFNSTNACFYTDHEYKISKTNPTFNWSFDKLGGVEGQTLEQLLGHLEIMDGSVEDFFKTLKSHGWVKVPKLRYRNGDKIQYFSLDVAITKHGDLESLTGVQGQFLETTTEVELAQSVEDLLNNAGQGFLSFCADGVIQPKFSQACVKFFGDGLCGKNIHDLMFEPGSEDHEEQKKSLAMIFDGTGDMDLVRDLLASEITVGERILGVDYRWIPKSESNAMNKIMLILTDITKEKALQAQLQEDQLKQETILKIVNDRQGFVEGQHEIREIFGQLKEGLSGDPMTLDMDALFRQAHTVKGGSAIHGLHEVVSTAHELEGSMTRIKEHGAPTVEQLGKLKADVAALEKLYETTVCDLNKMLGFETTEEKVHSIPQAKLDAFGVKLHGELGVEPAKLQPLLSELTRAPLKPILSKFETVVTSLAERLDKLVEFSTEGSEVEVDRDKTAPVFQSLIHLVRNCVDHGVEDPESRLEAGKDETGRISIKAEKVDGDLDLTIEDDGKGLDPNHIAKIALEKGVVTQEWVDQASDEDKQKLIFAPGFSTAEEVSDVSGRGVGMDAVQTSINETGGSLRVISTPGQGTAFKIKLPKVA